IPGSQDHRHEIEQRQREVACDVVEPGDHSYQDYGQDRGGSVRHAAEELERAMNRSERLFPSRATEPNRRDEKVRVTELLCSHLDLFSSIPFRLPFPNFVLRRLATQ